MHSLTLFFPVFSFDPPKNIRKTFVIAKWISPFKLKISINISLLFCQFSSRISSIFSQNISCEIIIPRNSHRSCSVKKVALKSFTLFLGKQCVGVSFYKGAGLKYYNFIKKVLQHRCFPVNVAKFLRSPILKNICGYLLHYTATEDYLGPYQTSMMELLWE